MADSVPVPVEMFGAASAGPGEPGTVPMHQAALPVQRDGQAVPAVIWLAGAASGPRPLVLVGHGAGGSMQAPIVTGVARRLTALGCAVVAIDLPYHGERTPPDEVGLSARERRARLGLSAWRDRNAQATSAAVADWQAAIDAAQALPEVGRGPVGYFGLSLGTRSGLPLAAAESRLSAAVLGLFGHAGPAGPPGVAEAAGQVTIPVLFLVQWDDELYPRSDGFALFELLASERKTLHANPGGHMDVPRSEFAAAMRFLADHLGVISAT